jgi:nitrate/nitrite transport system ATP-binding protein
MNRDKFLQLEGIHKTFQLPGGKEYKAVVDVDVNIKKNEIVSIIGHSGCGKSTLLNMIAGLDSQTKGHIILNNKEITGPGPERAVVFQNHSLLPWLTVYQNIEMAVKKVMPNLSSAELKERVLHFVSMVNLDHAKDKYPGEISGGMKQRVGIARANLQEHLMRIQQSVENTVIIITHDIDEAVLLSDRVIMMTNGPEATIGEILEVKLPRPRDRVALQSDPEYIRFRESILDFLYKKFAKDDE